MRKITLESATALKHKKYYKKSNMFVVGGHYKLHGHEIVEFKNNRLFLNNCGYYTNTTKERLNGVLSVFNTGLKIIQRDFQWFIVDKNNNITTFINGMDVKLSGGEL